MVRDTSTGTTTRPADTNAYAAQDAISDSTSSPTVMSFANIGVNSITGQGRITGCYFGKTGATETGWDVDLVLYNASPTAFEDNAEWDPSDAEMLTEVGVITFLATEAVVGKNNVRWHRTNLDISFKCAADGTTLYGVPVARGTPTPESGEVLTFRLDWEAE